jgi:hypothetical protein
LNIPDAEKVREQKKKNVISTPTFPSTPIFEEKRVDQIIAPISFDNLSSVFSSSPPNIEGEPF